jgi:hypothetical protein
MKGRTPPPTRESRVVFDEHGQVVSKPEPTFVPAAAYQRPWGGPVQVISPRQRRKQMRKARREARNA